MNAFSLAGRSVSPLRREVLPQLSQVARAIGMDLQGAIVSQDGVYDCRANRKAIFNRGMHDGNIQLNNLIAAIYRNYPSCFAGS